MKGMKIGTSPGATDKSSVGQDGRRGPTRKRESPRSKQIGPDTRRCRATTRLHTEMPGTHMYETWSAALPPTIRSYTHCVSMKSDSCGVAPLKKDGASSLEAHDKAVILNDQFSSEYTTEDDVFQILDQVLQHQFVDC